MSTNNKKNLATQALIDMEKITEAIKEESKKSLSLLLNEAVKNALRENCNEDEEKDYEVNDEMDDANSNENEQDVTTSDIKQDEMDDEVAEPIGGDTSEEDVETPAQEEPEAENEPEVEGDEWSEFSKYQVGDNTYDLTGENDYENVVKVYKLLTDEDQVVIHKDGNKIQLKDDSVGTEYVIDLGDENGDITGSEEGEEDFDSLNEGIMDKDEFDPIYQLKKRGSLKSEPGDIAGFEGDEEEFEEEPEALPTEHEPSRKDIRDIESWLDGINPEPSFDDDVEISDFDETLYESKMNNFNKKSRKPMKESKEVLFEVDLGYTDNYQDKDPIAGLSNNEPSKSGKSWHKGVPTGTQKPWAGETKSKGEPFENTVNEEEIPDMGVEETPVEEGATSVSTQTARKENKTRTSNVRRNYLPQVSKNVSTAEKGYEDVVNENKKLKAENKALKEAILAIRKNLTEAYVTNANLGKITKLFLENTTSQAEKVDIVNRFSNEAKTIEQSNVLYESIKRELNKNVTTQMPINEAMTSTNNTINEVATYKSNGFMASIDLMNRMKNC